MMIAVSQQYRGNTKESRRLAWTYGKADIDTPDIEDAMPDFEATSNHPTQK